MTPAQAGAVARVALFSEWRRQVAAGELTRAGLLSVRARLDCTTGEFEPGPDLDLLALDIDQILADEIGCDLADLPGRGVPDFPPDPPGDAAGPRW